MLKTAELIEMLRAMRAEGVARFSLHPDGTPNEVVLGPLPVTMPPMAGKQAESDEDLLFAHEGSQ